jgi:hypothetical protein
MWRQSTIAQACSRFVSLPLVLALSLAGWLPANIRRPLLFAFCGERLPALRNRDWSLQSQLALSP